MIKFLLQKENNMFQNDFAFEMEHAVEYQNWRKPYSMSVEYASLNDLEYQLNPFVDENFIPIGTIEFVYKYIDKYICSHGSKQIHPINVPTELMDYEYTKRWIINYNINSESIDKLLNMFKDNSIENRVFIKSNSIIKSNLNDFYNVKSIDIPDDNYQISEAINIVSEYRCFVYNDELKGIQYYSGDFTKFPDANKILEMIDIYRYDYGNGLAPQAYTLDVAVTDKNETCVIEVHEFFSCGLYGFTDYTCLPYMFKRAFDNIKRRLKYGNE